MNYSVYPLGNGYMAVVIRGDGYREFETARQAHDYIESLMSAPAKMAEQENELIILRTELDEARRLAVTQ